MSDDHPPQNLDALLYQLEQRDIPGHKVENEPHIRLITRLNDQKGGLHIRWEAVEEIILIFTVLATAHCSIKGMLQYIG